MALKRRNIHLPVLMAQDVNPLYPREYRIHVRCETKPMKNVHGNLRDLKKAEHKYQKSEWLRSHDSMAFGLFSEHGDISETNAMTRQNRLYLVAGLA